MTAFPWFDLALVLIVVASATVGLLRGLVREVLSLGSWLLAGWLAYLFAGDAAALFSRWLTEPRLQVIAAGVSIFLLAMILLGLLSTLLVKVINSIGLKGVDRSLGGLFGLLRAFVIIAGMVLLLQALRFDQTDWWRNSYLVGLFELPAQVLASVVDAIVADLSAPSAEGR